MTLQKTYALTGLHCQACVGRVSNALTPYASQVQVSLEPMQAILTHPQASLAQLQTAVSQAGKYALQEVPAAPTQSGAETWVATYFPLLLILAFVLFGSLLLQIGLLGTGSGQMSKISFAETMRYFMAGFFLVFAFFKLLNLRAFAQAYAGYDLLAAKWQPWGLIYPFIELALGMAYLANWQLHWAAWITLLVMGFSAIGVIRAVLSKKQIQCACLGTVFKLPMSTVTIVEDLAMVAMAAWMLLSQ